MVAKKKKKAMSRDYAMEKLVGMQQRYFDHAKGRRRMSQPKAEQLRQDITKLSDSFKRGYDSTGHRRRTQRYAKSKVKHR